MVARKRTFVIAPSVDPEPFAASIGVVWAAHRAFLDAIVAEPPNLDAFVSASQAYIDAAEEVAAELPVSVENSSMFLRTSSWLMNAAAWSFTDAGITASAIDELIDQPENLTRFLEHLPFQVETNGDDTGLEREIRLAVDDVLRECRWLVCNRTRFNQKVSSFRRLECHLEQSRIAGRAFTALHDLFPLQGFTKKEDGFQAWRFVICRITLQLLGYGKTQN